MTDSAVEPTSEQAGKSVPAASGRAAAILLFFLTPAIAELLSGSSPPAEYFNPISLLIQCCAYGGLAVLLREFAVRRGLGWWGRLPLALTMGIFIEGALCKSLYSTHWVDFSFPEGYGRLWGVNWSWALALVAYHGLMSFLLPWMAVELVYPALRSAPALTRRSTAWLWAGVVATGLFGYLVIPMTPHGKDIYHPGVLATLFSWGALLWAPALAGRLGPRLDALARAAQPLLLPPLLNPRWLGWACGLGWFVFFFCQYTGEKEAALPPAAVTMFMQGMVLVVALVIAWNLRGMFSERHRHACLLGTAWFWAVFGLMQEVDNAKRPDNTAGMALTGLLGVLAAYWLSRVLRQRETAVAQGTSASAITCAPIVDKSAPGWHSPA